MADWEKDNFLAEFLSDSCQMELENCATSLSIGDLPPDPIATDELLSKYLEGEVQEYNNDDALGLGESELEAQCKSAWSPQSSQISGDDGMNLKDRQIIIVSTSSQDNDEKRKGNSNSKQALAARQNRLKKKEYVSGLEKLVETLKEENTSLQKLTSDQQLQIQTLQREVSYLKGVIANDSALSTVLTSMLNNASNLEGVRISSSFFHGTSRTVCEEKKDLPQAGLIASGPKCGQCQTESTSRSSTSMIYKRKAEQMTCEEAIPRKQACLSAFAQRDHCHRPEQQTVQQESASDMTVTVKTNCGRPHLKDACSSNAMNRHETFLHNEDPFMTGSTTKPTDDILVCVGNSTEVDSSTGTCSGDLHCVRLLSPRDGLDSFADHCTEPAMTCTSDHAYSKSKTMIEDQE